MSGPWFRQRWFGYQPIHRNGWIKMAASWAFILGLLAVIIGFAGSNNIVAGSAAIVLFVGLILSGAITVLKSEKR